MPKGDENRSLSASIPPYDDRSTLSNLDKAEVSRASRIPQPGGRSGLKPRQSKALLSPRPQVNLGHSTTSRPAVQVQLPTSEPSRAASSSRASSSPDRSYLSLDDALGLSTMDPVASTSKHNLDPPHTIKRAVRSSLSVSSLCSSERPSSSCVMC